MRLLRRDLLIGLMALALTVTIPLCPDRGLCVGLSDTQIAAAVGQEPYRSIIEEFLRRELQDVNRVVTEQLLPQHPSLTFFIKQAKRNPLESLLFLEKQVHRLRDAQKNIDRLPYSIAFSSSEKKKVLDLEPTAKRIISFGIPLMKRDFFLVARAANKLASMKKKDVMELLRDRSFRDEVYRRCAPTAQKLDEAMGELSEGELICMRLGWVLETVTVTRLWLVFNDNNLPDPEDFKVYRAKRSEYWKKRLKEIYARN